MRQISRKRRATLENNLTLLDLPQKILNGIFLKLDLKSLRDIECTCKVLNHRVKSFREANREHVKSLKIIHHSTRTKLRVTQSKTETSETTNSDTGGFKYRYFFIPLLFLIIASIYNELSIASTKDDAIKKEDITINFEHLDKINQMYPGLLSTKKMRIIRTRISVMLNEVSVLMLLGKSRDNHCKYDPTFCIGKTIANVTQLQYSYINAGDPHLNSVEVQQELWRSLDGTGISIMIDSLEKLPGSEVMNLFQFIDKDATHRRRGMLLFVVYTGSELATDLTQLKEADIAERILMKRWSQAVPKDSLTSLLSRMCGSIVKVL